MAFALVLLFFLSADAWANGDDSMSWVVVLGIIFMAAVFLFSKILY